MNPRKVLELLIISAFLIDHSLSECTCKSDTCDGCGKTVDHTTCSAADNPCPSKMNYLLSVTLRFRDQDFFLYQGICQRKCYCTSSGTCTKKNCAKGINEKTTCSSLNGCLGPDDSTGRLSSSVLNELK